MCATRIACALGEDRDIQLIGQQSSRLFGLVDVANDQHAPCTLESDGGHRLRLGQMRRSEQGGDFGRGVFGVLAPATRFTDVDELDDRRFGLGLHRKFAKQPLLLCASDHHIVLRIGVLHCANEFASFASAQRGVQLQRFIQALAQRLRVERLGLVAVANQRGHARVCLVVLLKDCRLSWTVPHPPMFAPRVDLLACHLCFCR